MDFGKKGVLRIGVFEIFHNFLVNFEDEGQQLY